MVAYLGLPDPEDEMGYMRRITAALTAVILVAGIGISCSDPNLPRLPQPPEDEDPGPDNPQDPAMWIIEAPMA